ncbi:MAG: hypothetical protein ACPG4X_21520 [Pikeienuella sp.]
MIESPADILGHFADRDALTPHVLCSLIEYFPETGLLAWRDRPLGMFKSPRAHSIFASRYAGAPALACFDESNGYLKGAVLGVKMYAHRAAFMIHNKSLICGVIDHLNKDRTDNRAINLRDVSLIENARNTTSYGDSGELGVYWCEPTSKWQAKIGCNGRSYSGGYFSSKQDAIRARKMLEDKYWG